ncbi:hypothetical protein BDR05DRAFT_888342, partial [Suillus weaverae]
KERKKNKNKYVPLWYGKIPTGPSIIPTAYTIRKLKVGDHCKLHYFTNKGLDTTKIVVLVAKLEALIMLPELDGVHAWVPVAAVKDPKNCSHYQRQKPYMEGLQLSCTSHDL